MPLFNESHDAATFDRGASQMRYVYSLEDCFSRRIPVTSIEFNPPPVPNLEMQDLSFWRALDEPDDATRKILAKLKKKLRAMRRCLESGSFMSVTDSAAGVLRMNNLTMLRLFEDPLFTQKHFSAEPIVPDPKRTLLHLTRNHSVAWLRRYLRELSRFGYEQLLIITGDPLKEVKLRTSTCEKARGLDEKAAEEVRLKNSIELLGFVRETAPDLFTGAAHNPFLRRKAATKHLMRKVEAGARFLVTQPVSYYEECWEAMEEFEAFCSSEQLSLPVILGVFNYAVPCGPKGYKTEVFEKRHKFWKRLFGFVPEGVRTDYDRGLEGIEIMARSINKLKRMGYFHFDVMNAERNGWTVVTRGRSFTHEADRIEGAFADHSVGPADGPR